MLTQLACTRNLPRAAPFRPAAPQADGHGHVSYCSPGALLLPYCMHLQHAQLAVHHTSQPALRPPGSFPAPLNTHHHRPPPPISPPPSPHLRACLPAPACPAGINDTQLTLHDIIGSGSFGTVYRGLWQGLPVAVKTIVFSASSESRRRALQEAALCQSVSHPNIVATYAVDAQPIGAVGSVGSSASSAAASSLSTLVVGGWRGWVGSGLPTSHIITAQGGRPSSPPAPIIMRAVMLMRCARWLVCTCLHTHACTHVTCMHACTQMPASATSNPCDLPPSLPAVPASLPAFPPPPVAHRTGGCTLCRSCVTAGL